MTKEIVLTLHRAAEIATPPLSVGSEKRMKLSDITNWLRVYQNKSLKKMGRYTPIGVGRYAPIGGGASK